MDVFVFALGSLVIPMLSQLQVPSPLPTRSQLLPSLAFLRFEPLSNLGPDTDQDWSFGLTSANVFFIHTSGIRSVIQDYEVERLALQYRRKLRGGWTGAIELPYVFVGGGFQDQLIDWWHSNILHWSDATRIATPRGQSQIHLGDENFNGSTNGPGDITTSATTQIGPRSSAAVAVKWPTGDAKRLLGSGGVDLGLSAQHRFALSRGLEFHVQLGAVWQGPSRLPGARHWAHQEMMALTWQRNSRDQWILQWQGESAPLHLGISDVDGTQRVISFGYRRSLSEREELTAFLSEDGDLFSGSFPVGASLGPDLTLGVKLQYRF